MERRGDRDLDPKLVGAVRLALADAFDLGRVQRIDFPLALMLALLAHPARQHERMAEDTLQFGFALDLAADVANDPAKIGAQRLQRPVGALELFGVGMALVGDERPLAHPLVRLAQLDAGLLRQPHQSLASPVHQFCVGRERHSLRLHGGVDNHLGEIRGLRRAGAGRRRQALLDQRDQLLFAHPLAPAGQRRAIGRRLVLEELLAAEQLVIGVLDPARAQLLVREIVHVLEDRQPRHQPGRKRRMAGFVGVDRAEPLLQEPPVDDLAELRQRMSHVDDLVEPRPKEIVLPAVPPLFRPHRINLRQADGRRESRPATPINLQEIKPANAAFLQLQRLKETHYPTENQASPDSSRTTNYGTISVANDSTLNLNATITNSSTGTLALNGSTGPTKLEIYGSGATGSGATVSGGYILLSNSAENSPAQGSGGQLILDNSTEFFGNIYQMAV